VEAGQTISNVPLRLIKCEEKRIRCLRVQLGQPVTLGHKENWSSRLEVRSKTEDLAAKKKYCCEIQKKTDAIWQKLVKKVLTQKGCSSYDDFDVFIIPGFLLQTSYATVPPASAHLR
jgi:hypothetical protein